MKRLLAVLLALSLVLIPFAAQASTIYLTISLPATYRQSHHFGTEISNFTSITTVGSLDYSVSDISGIIDPNAQCCEVETGELVTWDGIQVYFYNRFGSGWGCYGKATPAFYASGRYWGCELVIPSLTLYTDEPVRFEIHFYPQYNEWAFWAVTNGTAYEIAYFYTSVDYLSLLTNNQALVYSGGVNPDWQMDGQFINPQGWINGNWTPYTSATLAVSTTNPLDSGVCTVQHIYGFLALPQSHEVFAGSLYPDRALNYVNSSVCSGNAWVQ